MTQLTSNLIKYKASECLHFFLKSKINPSKRSLCYRSILGLGELYRVFKSGVVCSIPNEATFCQVLPTYMLYSYVSLEKRKASLVYWYNPRLWSNDLNVQFPLCLIILLFRIHYLLLILISTYSNIQIGELFTLKFRLSTAFY